MNPSPQMDSGILIRRSLFFLVLIILTLGNLFVLFRGLISTPILRNVHHMGIIGICALPLVLALSQKVHIGMDRRDRGGVSHWAPYYAPALNNKTSGLKGWVAENQIVFSDQPWEYRQSQSARV